MKHRIVLCFLLALILCLPLTAVTGEGMTVASFFPEASCYHAACDTPGNASAFDAVFYPDGSVHGVTDALEEICGYYAILPDGTLLLDAGAVSAQLTRETDGGYTGDLTDQGRACTLTPIERRAFDDAAKKADLYIDAELDRVDVPLWDYPIYARITMSGGIDLLLNPAWPEIAAGHLDAGTVVLIRGQWFDDDARTDEDIWLMEADGVRGFALSTGLEELPVRRAKVVRYKKEKGRSVNVRSSPDYGDNVIMEVPYGEIVDVFPVTKGDFTRVYYDHGPGWMTTVRLQIIDD